MYISTLLSEETFLQMHPSNFQEICDFSLMRIIWGPLASPPAALKSRMLTSKRLMGIAMWLLTPGITGEALA